jgi:hypothetical protein
MRKLNIILAGLLAGAATIAAAQDAPPPETTTKAGLGADVRTLAKAQRTAETKGIGVEVSAKARAARMEEDPPWRTNGPALRFWPPH